MTGTTARVRGESVSWQEMIVGFSSPPLLFGAIGTWCSHANGSPRPQGAAGKHIPYGSVPQFAGKAVPLNTPSADCIAAMSGSTRKPLMNVKQLMDPAQSDKYYSRADENGPGVWTVVRYRERLNREVAGASVFGPEEGHTQLNMGQGRYFDSIPSQRPGDPGGPHVSDKYVLDYLRESGAAINEYVLLSPK